MADGFRKLLASLQIIFSLFVSYSSISGVERKKYEVDSLISYSNDLVSLDRIKSSKCDCNTLENYCLWSIYSLANKLKFVMFHFNLFYTLWLLWGLITLLKIDLLPVKLKEWNNVHAVAWWPSTTQRPSWVSRSLDCQ